MTEVPARVNGPNTQVLLKIISQCKLHDSRVPLNAGEVVERRARAAELRIESVRDVSVTLEVLTVGDVEGFPTNGELVVLAPGHCKALVKPRIQ